MKALVLATALLGCEHDPRFEHHQDKRPAPAVDARPPQPEPVVQQRTIERIIAPAKKRRRH